MPSYNYKGDMSSFSSKSLGRYFLSIDPTCCRVLPMGQFKQSSCQNIGFLAHREEFFYLFKLGFRGGESRK